MAYETKQNIADEEKLVRLFAEDHGTGQPIQTPQFWPFDYLVPVGSKLSACECRQRHNNHDHYQTLITLAASGSRFYLPSESSKPSIWWWAGPTSGASFGLENRDTA